EVSRRELCTIVAAEVSRLPAKFRSPLILHYWEGRTSEEVARQLGCPTGSMSWHLRRGRGLLRRPLRGLWEETAPCIAHALQGRRGSPETAAQPGSARLCRAVMLPIKGAIGGHPGFPQPGPGIARELGPLKGIKSPLKDSD